MGKMENLITSEDFPDHDVNEIKTAFRSALDRYCSQLGGCVAPDPDAPFPPGAKTEMTKTGLFGWNVGYEISDPKENNPLMGVRTILMRTRGCKKELIPAIYYI